MSSQIKIFINERELILSGKGIKSFYKDDGFFYKLEDPEGLMPLISFFENTPEMPRLYIICNPKKALSQLKERYKYVKAAGGLVSNNKDELLMIYRRGKWDLPKGKLEPDETSKEAALREVAEECGLNEGLCLKKLLSHTYHTYHENGINILKRTSWFRMKYTGTENPVPQTEEDIKEVLWVGRENLDSLIKESYASLKPILKKF